MPMEKVMVKRSGREILKSMLTSTFIVFAITFMIIGLMVFYNKIRYAYDFIPAFLIFVGSIVIVLFTIFIIFRFIEDDWKEKEKEKKKK